MRGTGVERRAEVVQRLAEQMRAVRVGAYAAEPDGGEFFSTGVPELDEWLPQGGMPRRGLVEWLGEWGGGAWTLGVKAAANAVAEGGKVVVVDPRGEFYPPAARLWGLDPAELLLVRPPTVAEAVWAMDEALRCKAVGVVVGIVERLDHRFSRKLQLAAEAGGRPCLLFRPASARNEPSWAEIRWLVRPLPSNSPLTRLVEVGLLRCRGHQAEQPSMWLEIDDAAGTVRVVPELAVAASSPRSTRTAPHAARAV